MFLIAWILPRIGRTCRYWNGGLGRNVIPTFGWVPLPKVDFGLFVPVPDIVFRRGLGQSSWRVGWVPDEGMGRAGAKVVSGFRASAQAGIEAVGILVSNLWPAR